MKETPAATEPIVVECDLPHPPAQVWRALTERDLLGAWLLPNDLSPEAGARFRFQPEGREASSGMDCEVLEAEPHRILRWRQSEAAPSGSAGHSIDSVVTVELTVKPDGGTHLRLVHEAFTVVSSKAQRPSFVPQACASIIPFKFGGSRRSSPIEDRGRQLEDTGHFRAPLRRAA